MKLKEQHLLSARNETAFLLRTLDKDLKDITKDLRAKGLSDCDKDQLDDLREAMLAPLWSVYNLYYETAIMAFKEDCNEQL